MCGMCTYCRQHKANKDNMSLASARIMDPGACQGPTRGEVISTMPYLSSCISRFAEAFVFKHNVISNFNLRH